MKSKLTIGIIGGMLLTLFTPTSLKAQAVGDIGTNRQQQTCPSRSEPKTGAVSAAQAIKYATCEAEADRIIKSSGRTDFIDIFSLQVNPKPRQAEYLDINYFGKAIANSPVYDIRGTAVAYSCAVLDNRAGGGRPGKNCLNTHPDDRNSVGVCFREPAGNWRCRLSVGGGKGLQLGPPPGNASASGSSETQTAPNDNGEAYFEQAKIKIEKDDDRGALADMNRAIQINPNNADFYHFRARIKRRKKDFRGELADLNRAIQINPNNADSYVNRAGIKRSKKDSQGALADFNRAIQISPNNAYFYADRGHMRLACLKDRAGAIKDWQQAAKLCRQQGNTIGYQMMLNYIKETKDWDLEALTC
jgi:tetratricopeptide (TPR) repeat protein